MATLVAIALPWVMEAKMPMAAIVVAEEEAAKTVAVKALMARRPSRTAVPTTPAAMATADARLRLARTMEASTREVKVRGTCNVVEVPVALVPETTAVVPTTTSVATMMASVVVVVVEAEEVVAAEATAVVTAVATRTPSEWLLVCPCA